MISDKGWFVEGGITYDADTDEGALVLIPTIIVASTPNVWEINFAWLCFGFAIGRTYG